MLYPNCVRHLVASVATITLCAFGTRAQILGMVASSAAQVTVFDADTHAVLGVVAVPTSGWTFGDCAIRPDRRLGFVTDFNSRVWVIDLTTSPPVLASGTNPIPISNYGEDLSFAPDGRHLVVTDGSATQPVCVIDTFTRTQVAAFSTGTSNNSVECCPDGSVLVTSASGALRRLKIDLAGQLTTTPDLLATLGEPNNVICAPNGKTGVVMNRDAATFHSFTIPGLAAVNTRTLGFGNSGAFNPAGDRLFVRQFSAPPTIAVFAFDQNTGAIGAAPLFAIAAAFTNTFYGMDQFALHPHRSKVFVSEPGFLRVRSSLDGTLIHSIPINGTGFGVCLAPGVGFGSNCKGFGNPTIGFSGVMAIGSPNFAVTLKETRPNTLALLYLSAFRDDVLSGPCTIYPSTRIGITLNTMTNGAGYASIPMPLPNPYIWQLPMFCQWMIVDAGGPISGSVSMSDALFVTGN